MNTTDKKWFNARGFSLIEVLVVIAVLGIVASVSLALVRNISAPVESEKLVNDVNALNSAVSIYLTSGGSIDGKETATQVIAKLKSRANVETEDQVIGLRGYFVDPRLEPVMQMPGENAAGDERVYWNSANGKFEIATTGPPGISEFRLNEDLAEVPASTETRATVMDYARESGWVWDYQDHAAPALEGPTEVETFVVAENGVPSASTNPGPLPPTPPVPTTTLDPPAFSLAPGTFPITDYNLSVSISNPNPAGASSVIYSIDYGTWMAYTGDPLIISPDNVLKAQALPALPEYESSTVAEATYNASPVTLLAPAVVPSAPGFETGVVETITVAMNNPNDSAVSRIDYRIDGGVWTPYASPLTLLIADYPGGAVIDARAAPTAPYYTESPVASAAIAASSGPGGVERTTGIDPGSWSVSGATATYTFDDGTSITLTEVGTSWSSGTVNSWNAWSKPIDGTSSVEATFSSSDEFTLRVYDAANQPISPESIELHFDRLGGSAGAGVFTLQGGPTWASTSGNNGFAVTPTTVKTSLGGTNLSGGSVKLNQTVSSLTIVNTGVLDRIGVQITVRVNP